MGDLDRRYLYAFPDSAAGTAHPLVIALHGGGATPEGFGATTGLIKEGVRLGYAVAVPAGYGRSWNAGEGWGPAAQRSIDDIGFITALVQDLSTLVILDSRRFFAVGWSNGGKMAMRLGCEWRTPIRAVVSVGAGYARECPMPQPVSLLLFHGTADKLHPYDCEEPVDPGPGSLGQVGPVRTAELWAARLGCDPRSRETRVAPTVARSEFSGGREGAKVVLFTIEGMGHQWPGHTLATTPEEWKSSPGTIGEWPPWLAQLGSGSDEIDATLETFNFFHEHV